MESNTINEREFRRAKVVHVLVRGAVINELALERGSDPPDGLGVGMGADVAQVRGEGLRERLSANLAAEEFESDEQTIVILEYLRLGRDDSDIPGRAFPDVFHEQA